MMRPRAVPAAGGREHSGERHGAGGGGAAERGGDGPLAVPQARRRGHGQRQAQPRPRRADLQRQPR